MKVWEISEQSLGFPLLARIIERGVISYVENGDFQAFANMTHSLYMLLLPLLKGDKNFINEYKKLKERYNGKKYDEKFYFRLFELISSFLALRGVMWKILIHYRESHKVDEDSELNYLIEYLMKAKEGEVYAEI